MAPCSDHRCSLLLTMAMVVCCITPSRAEDVLEDEAQVVPEITQSSPENTQEWPILPGETLKGLAVQMYPENPEMQRRFLAAVMKANRGVLRGFADDTLFTQPTVILLPKPESIKIGSVVSSEPYSRSQPTGRARETSDTAGSEMLDASRQAVPVADKEAQDWPLLPGESLRSLAAQIYPKDRRMQGKFISATQKLNPQVFNGTGSDTTFAQAVLIRLPELRELSSYARREERKVASVAKPPASVRQKTAEDSKSFRVSIGAGGSQSGTETTAADNSSAPSSHALSLADQPATPVADKSGTDQPGFKTVSGARLPPLRLARQLSLKAASPGFRLTLSADVLDLRHGEISEAERSRLLAAKRETMDYDDLTARNLALKEAQERLDQRSDHLQGNIEQLQQRGGVENSKGATEVSRKHQKVRVVEKSWFGELPGFSMASLGLLLMLIVGIALPVWLYRRYKSKSQDEQYETVSIEELSPTSAEAEFDTEPVADELQASEPVPSADQEAQEMAPDNLSSHTIEFESNEGIQVEAVDSVVEEARVLVAIGRTEQAINMLNEHIQALPELSPQPWLYLLEVYRASNKQQEFSDIAKRFHLAFNVITPTWERAAVNMVVPMSLEEFPHIIKRICSMWGTQDAKTFLTSLIHDNRGGERIGFSLEVLKDILLLLAILDMRDFFRSEISFDASHGKLYDYPNPNT